MLRARAAERGEVDYEACFAALGAGRWTVPYDWAGLRWSASGEIAEVGGETEGGEGG